MAHLEVARRGSAGRAPAGRLTFPNLPDWWVAPVGALALLTLWETLVRAGWVSTLYFPHPSIIGRTFVHMVWEEGLSTLIDEVLSEDEFWTSSFIDRASAMLDRG